MRLFLTDLDNTLIYSYKHAIGTAKKCVEIYQGREISFVTERTYELLKKINEEAVVVPATTRSMEQYARINLGIGTPRHALVCNGGVLLSGGHEDLAWYEQSLALVSESREALSDGEKILARDKNRCFEIRNIKGLFLFTKSEKPLFSAGILKKSLDLDKVDVFSNGAKVYIVPRKLNKGTALLRLKEKLHADTVIAAGDSGFDIPMLNCSDIAAAPKELQGMAGIRNHVEYMQGGGIFSEEMLAFVLDYLRNSKKICNISKENGKTTDK